MSLLRVALVCSASWLVACATGVVDDEGFVLLDGGEGGSGGLLWTTTSTSTTKTGSSGGSTAGGAGGALGGLGGTGAAGGDGGGGPACGYDSPNGCATATPLPAIAGDEGNAPATVSGTTSAWFQIHVEEQVSSIFPENLSYTATLTSPPGMDWDLFVHEGPQDGAPDCQAPAIKGQGPSGSESVHSEWNDDQGFLGEDDSVWLSIEVRHQSGSLCGAAAQWTLTVQGHT